MTNTVALANSAARGVRRNGRRLARLWRQSLRFRTMVIALALTSVAVLVTCVLMALAVQNQLWDARKDQALRDAWRAANSAQSVLYSANTQGSQTAGLGLMRDVRDTVQGVSASRVLGVFPLDPNQLVPGIAVGGFNRDELVSDQLQQRVAKDASTQWWQPVALRDADGSEHAGILVGQQLTVPGSGSYALYVAYDLADTEQTLALVQGSLWIAGLVLVALIGAIAWFSLRTVVEPITAAAETSARFAGGDLDVRLPVHGQDELATLGRSFNAMADSIEAQIKELGELSLVQQRFVSDVSHELRTPLTTIRLAAEMLNDRREEFDPTTARTAELLQTQVHRFDTLLADLLEISRYDAGSVQLETEATSLAHLAEDLVDEMRPLAQTHDTELRFVAPGGHTPVDLDPRRVRRILRNLIGNAIEHGEGHPIVVTVDSNQNAVAVGVRDQGMGMTAEDAERVFDRFWRADPSRQRTIGGTGLGLSIALGDARLHRGTLAVWSRPGEGTNFVLTLPRGSRPLDGASPVPLEAVEPIAELGVSTAPLAVAEAGAALRQTDEDQGES
ncbi:MULTISPECIES: MtrAB system histidine kinase MtrB [unclassified Microbacterium]|uniref:MtrAB system histidine kinase MtrB n=1 Tax=unclassified Microbacterium TaxID=2609290 RepID=UPI001AD0EB10|nr:MULTISPECIES: MtrAB system histidine kinase MtrB [unclassified Microbacterium]MBN9156286.1 HAMP domain-containing protein [Microbacterium sp.]MBS1896628.1 HAMP domain-containing protein [Actinomycetota bacterium]MBS1899195.1 HAMP domain-containing protein [Actinomycetota bacterium]